MVKYLKKSKIRSILLGLGIPVPALRDCSYRSYRGSEWLRFHDGVDDYEVYCCNVHMSIEKQYYDEENLRYVTLERRVIHGNDYFALVSSF